MAMDEPILDISIDLRAVISTHAYMCIKGKPTSVVSVQTRYIKKAIDVVKSHNLKYHIKKLADGWCELWMYDNPIMKEIIECTPDKPASNYDHWILGKLFGYSDEKIFEFMNKQDRVEIDYTW